LESNEICPNRNLRIHTPPRGQPHRGSVYDRVFRAYRPEIIRAVLGVYVGKLTADSAGGAGRAGGADGAAGAAETEEGTVLVLAVLVLADIRY